jgi:serine/threonine protein kinase
MAPEQIEGGTVTTAADLYALGLVMYEMITGDRPVPGFSTTNAAGARDVSARPALNLNEAVPRWDVVIRRCLQRDPKDRYSNAEELMAALTGPPVAATKARASLAMLGFRNLNGRPETGWFATAFNEMLATELAAGETLRLIPGENVNRVQGDLALGESDSLAPDTLAQARILLGADWVTGRAAAGCAAAKHPAR